VCKASPLDFAETTRDRLLVLDPDLKVRFADRSFGDASTVTPKDTPRDKEGLQWNAKESFRSIPKCFSRR
jgi:hypothetical protein